MTSSHWARLKPNTRYTCEICGVLVEKYLTPTRQREWPGRFCGRTCAGKWRQRENHPRWNGGRYQDGDGYFYILKPDHPNANKDGAIFEHRLVMELQIGRLLGPSEVVHHINGDPSDNRIENLHLFATQAEHKLHHNEARERDRYGRYTARS